MAAALGHVLRSMRYYSREKLCRARGRCAASWAAELFEVSTKSIERGRSVLVREGCLIKLDGAGPLRGKAKSLETRYGWHFVLNMLWQKPCLDADCPSPPESHRPILSEPREQQTSPKVLQTPELRTAPRAGVSKQKKTTLDAVSIEDLRDVGRCIKLGVQARARGWVRFDPTENRVPVLSLAVRALNYATNPSAFFRRMLERGDFRTITQSDEDQACELLRAFDGGRTLADAKLQSKEDVADARHAQVARLRALERSGEELSPSAKAFIEQWGGETSRDGSSRLGSMVGEILRCIRVHPSQRMVPPADSSGRRPGSAEERQLSAKNVALGAQASAQYAP